MLRLCEEEEGSERKSVSSSHPVTTIERKCGTDVCIEFISQDEIEFKILKMKKRNVQYSAKESHVDRSISKGVTEQRIRYWGWGAPLRFSSWKQKKRV
jgi:hypothetical protein